MGVKWLKFQRLDLKNYIRKPSFITDFSHVLEDCIALGSFSAIRTVSFSSMKMSSPA